MKKIAYLCLFTLFFASCEKDDFCIEPITPNLIIRFYDGVNTTETKAVSELYVWPEGRDSILINATTDSIAIPLDVNNSSTIYNLSMGTTQDQITINYTTEEVFVSRSCGFKAIFNDVSVSANNIWITNTSVISTNIENESSAHIQIFH